MKNRRGVRSVMVGKRMTRREINQRDHPLIEILNHDGQALMMAHAPSQLGVTLAITFKNWGYA